MVLDPFIQQRLRNRRIVHFAVPVPPITNQVHHNFAAKNRAVFRRHASRARNRVRILGIYVENRNVLPFRQIRGESPADRSA